MRWIWRAGLLLLCGTVQAQDYAKALRLYKSWIRRPSLHKRTLARERLARTGDVRALRILAAGYARPEKPKAQVKYLIAAIAADAFTEPEHVPVFRQWREKHSAPHDAWLWYLSLDIDLDMGEDAALQEIVLSDRNAFLRAAALEVLCHSEPADLLAFLPRVVAALPDKPVQRAVLVESLAKVLMLLRDERKKPIFDKPARAIMGLMDAAATLPRTRIVMGRQFAKLFGVKFVWRSGKRWIAELDFIQRGGKQAKDDRYTTRPTFAGIEATGDRVCYVIDMSDSMLEPLTVEELKKLPRGPVSGTAKRRQRVKESKSEAWKKAFSAVKWKKVKNRFDAARELLKTSLLLLDEKQYFAVIGFGDRAATLKTTKTMRQATLASVKGVMRELDAIRAGPKGGNRPHGTLRGKTNMHGALHRAFKLTASRMVGPGEYVNPATFKTGCDTIFLLSDGAATWDDWPQADSRDQGDHAGDPELGGRQPDTPQLEFPGPYRRAYHLVTDVRRLNLFRKVEIHCVAMGEANMNTLERIAAIGLGETVNLRRR